ncbi:hypothetical protein [Streptomyces laculatispora]|uniref:hypothetical protein n=1 Tax=Streptomyces laculatispora TaxID=887464 RepID=UPI001A94DF7A|nr:hypothetical protein [Streptomyces laculatispora]MBO0917740.1 hypothetical protein [Streptomyces laculatispora]
MTEQTAAPAAESAPEPAGATPVTPPPVPIPPMPPRPPSPQHPAPRPPRRVLRAVARWTVAVLVLGGLGAGTAYAITSAERTDVPGLATKGDGRWDFPRLSLPALPAGAPRPFSDGNTAEIHHADLRRLLLPAPAGATADEKLTGGWVSTRQFVSEYEKDSRAGIGDQLKESALRHIAARGWTMPDGTSSRIYLLQFNSAGYAEAFHDDRYIGATVGDPLIGAAQMDLDETWSGGGKVESTSSHVAREPKPFGATQVRQAYLVAGDTVALILQSRPGAGGTERIPFHQTVILQNQLLG